jgi:hypothetical protein
MKNVDFTAFFTLHLTPPSSLNLLITENDGESSNDDSNDEDSSNKDAATAAADEESVDALDDDDLFPMAKAAPKKRGAAAGGRRLPPRRLPAETPRGRRQSMLTPPPRKKSCAAAARYSTEKRGCYTVNPYAHRLKNKIDVVLHEGGMPSKDAQPQVSLLLGGKTLSVKWKMSEKLFSELQASAQGIARYCPKRVGSFGFSTRFQMRKVVGK